MKMFNQFSGNVHQHYLKKSLIDIYQYIFIGVKVKVLFLVIRKTLLASNLEQVLAATPHKTPTVRPPASYHENYPS